MTKLADKVGFAILFLLALATGAHADHCRVNVRQNVVHHHAKAFVNHHAYHHQAAQVLYLVAPEIRYEAIVEKKLRALPDYEEFKEFQAFKAAQQAEQSEWKSTASGEPVARSLPDGSPDLLIKQKCAKCHTADSSDVVLDGSQAISADTYRRFSEMALTGTDIPTKMKPVLDSLQGDDLTNLLTEMLKLKPVEGEAGVLK